MDVTVEQSQPTTESILARKHTDSEASEESLTALREALQHFCPKELRGKAWKLLLRVNRVSASTYISLVEKGSSSLDDKIRQDTFRTMTTDTNFIEHVSEDMLVRLLNAFVWNKEGNNGNEELDTVTYVQGMNILAAPFLMTMPEMEAFFSFSILVRKWCPLYVHPTMKGVHCGLKLLDICLLQLDPVLYGFLYGKNITARTYAFASVMTLSACTPPSSELLYLWDFMFSYGLHLNILFIIAQLALIRTELLHSDHPANLLRVLPPLRARKIVHLTKSLCKKISDDLYDKLVRHTYDESVAEELGILSSTTNEQKDGIEELPDFMKDDNE
ncbi:rab-GTPase-TBC domain-containing protein [Mycotypha africana]|uniref:rab-GTPase-TBC domain-containing protein n=1 Tax=Mycotypha africana TaxID=64632 RepID=UPI00230078A0|nr:rab-GTPase-TBC domain-containing protein [Mycotypha africana]KAI8982089.1 rab-GTPase-TBC domain-containing protein [Mycotypha africana]